MNFKKELKRLDINQLDIVSKYMNFEKIFRERSLTEEQFLFVLKSTLNVSHDTILQYVSNTDMSFDVILKVAQTIVDCDKSSDYWTIILRQKCLADCLTNLVKLVDKFKLPAKLVFINYICDEETKDGDLVERMFALGHITENTDTWEYILGSKSCSIKYVQDNLETIKFYVGNKMWKYIAMYPLTKKFIEKHKDVLRQYYYIGFPYTCVFSSTNLNKIPLNEVMYVVKELWLNNDPNGDYDHLFSEIMRKCSFNDEVLKNILVAVPFKFRRFIYEHQPASRQYIKYDSCRNFVESDLDDQNILSNGFVCEQKSPKDTCEWCDIHIEIRLFCKTRLHCRLPVSYISARTILMNEIKYAGYNLILNITEIKKQPRYINRVLLLNQIGGGYIDDNIVLVDQERKEEPLVICLDEYDVTCGEYIDMLYGGGNTPIPIFGSYIHDIYEWRNISGYNLLVKLFEDRYYEECKQLIQKYGKTKLVDDECAENMFEIIRSGPYADGHESVMELIFN